MPPTLVIGELRQLARRVKALGVLSGVGLLLAAAIVSLLCIICLDYFFNLPPLPRLIICALALVILAWLVWEWIARPATRRISLFDLATRLEHAFPQFNDRLRSTVNFTGQSVPGSEAMKQRVVDETTTLFSQINIRSAISLRPVYQSAGAGVIAVALVVLLALLANPVYRQIAVDRLIHPFDAPHWPKTVRIDLVGQEPDRLPVGESMAVEMKLVRGDSASRKAILFYQQDNGAVQQQYMNRRADGTYVANVDPRLRSGSLHLWIQSGDDELRLAPVAIVPRMTIQSIRLEVSPPAYAHLAPVNLDLSANPAVVGVGSKVTLQVGFNKPMGKADPEIQPADANNSFPHLTWNRPRADSVSAQWTIEHSMRFHLLVHDADGFTNSAADEFAIIVRPDQLPIVQIQNPQRNEERTPQAIIPLQATAEDDYGISVFDLVVDRLGDKKHWVIPLVKNAAAEQGANWDKDESSADQQRYRLAWSWSLQKLADLNPGDVLEYRAEVRDNFELNGKTHGLVSSGRLRIAIVSQDQLSEHIAEQMRQLAQQVRQTLASQNRTAQETRTLAHDTAGKAKLDAADREILDRLAQQQGTSAAEAKQIADRLAAIGRQLTENQSPNQELKQTAVDARDLLNQAAEGPMKQSGNALAQIKTNNAPAAQRKQQLNQTQSNQRLAAEELNKALNRLGNVGSLNQSIDQIAALLEQQQRVAKETANIGNTNLGKTPAQMSPADQKRLAENAANQNSLAQKTSAALEQMSKQADGLSKSDPAAAQAMKQAADAGKQQQVANNQQQASQAIQQNQQSEAQSAQQQAELGLETILSTLRDAQREKLAELSRKLADLQTQIARLITRQAGHNLDNLSLQGSSAIRDAGEKLLNQLLKEADRPAMIPADMAQLTAGQEQTQRNTRDIGTSADQLPGGAEAAGMLIESAGKMERAGVLLEEKQLASAYDPQQTQALALLLDTKNKIDQLKAEADRKLAEQSRNSLRAVYTKIKADQDKLNLQTIQLDRAPRLPDGSRSRVDAIHLNQLVPSQAALADQIAHLDDRLTSLGGIVYLWANHDIHDGMLADKDFLSQSKTGQSTQVQQKQISDELAAMIASLAVEPPKKEFAQHSGGGGGGHGSPKQRLPSEVELRLLQNLQLAVNQRTANLDQPTKNTSELKSLGLRENQLRSLLDQLLQKASDGKVKLPPTPPNKNILPEELQQTDTSMSDLAQQLMTDQQATEAADQNIAQLGNRMARVYQRLGLNDDPGKTTQDVEKHIVMGIDQLIQLARQQQSQNSTPQSQQIAQQNQPMQPNQPGPANQQANQPSHASAPAQSSNVNGSAAPQTDLSQNIRQTMQDWGGLSARQRQAILQGASDTVIEKYKNLVDDYYRALAEKK